MNSNYLRILLLFLLLLNQCNEVFALQTSSVTADISIEQTFDDYDDFLASEEVRLFSIQELTYFQTINDLEAEDRFIFSLKIRAPPHFLI